MSKRFYITIVLFFLLLPKIQAETIVSASVIESDTIWKEDKSPFLIKDDLLINENSSLTIESGVKIIVSFRKDKPIKILVRGKLFAKGEESGRISFSSSRDKPGSWQGIIFEGPKSEASIIEYTKIENARCAIACFKTSPQIQHNILSKNEVAIVCEDHSSPSISSNIITNNGIAEIYPSSIHCSLWSSPLIQNNIIEKNLGHVIYCDTYSSPLISGNKLKTSIGADIVCASFSNPKIINNDLTGGTSEFGIILYNSSPEIIKNKISNKRIYCLTVIDSSPLISGNIFKENYIGIFCIRSSPLISGNSIFQSDFGLVLAENSHPEIKNNNTDSNSTEIKHIRNIHDSQTSGNRDLPFLSSKITLETTSSGEEKKLILFRSFSGGSWDIGLLDGTSLTWTMLTKNKSHNGSASWSPDGKSIAFTSNRDGNWDIFIMDYKSKNSVNVTNTFIYVEEAPPMWSPDGKKLCFLRETPECQTVLLDLNTKNIKKIDLKKIEKEYPGLYPLVFIWAP